MKLACARQAGIQVVFCVGESEEVREKGETVQFIGQQLNSVREYLDKECIIAYEPVWAIGTGKVATPEQV